MISTELEKDSTKEKIPTYYKAAFIAKPGTIEYKEMKTPQPNGNEVLVKLIGCGLCASNIPVWEGREWFSYPMEAGAPGHEAWGIVVSTGPEVKNLKPGIRVAALNTEAFSEFILVNEDDAVPVPEQMKDAPFPGEPFGCTVNIMKRADIREGQTVCIVGLGFLGLSLIPLVKKAGAKILALSRRNASLQLAFQFGADEVIKMDDHYRIIDEVKKLTKDKGCERVIECTGKQWPIDLAGELAATYGKIVIAGYHQDGLRNVNMQVWNWKGLEVVNAHERNAEKYRSGIREAAEAIVNGDLDPDLLLSHSFRFSELSEGLNTLTRCPDGLVKAYIKY